MIPKAVDFLAKQKKGYLMMKEEEFADVMIRFAKRHVHAALKAASSNVKLTDFATEFLQEGVNDAISESSILMAYPDQLIK